MSYFTILVEFLSNRVTVSRKCLSAACWLHQGSFFSLVENSVTVNVHEELGILWAIKLFFMVIAVGYVVTIHFEGIRDFDILIWCWSGRLLHFSACQSRLKNALWWVTTFALNFTVMFCDLLTLVMMQCSGSYSCMALFYCSSLIKTLFSGTKGRVLVCCFLSANYLAFCLHAVCVLLFLFFDKWRLFFSTR